MFWNKNKDRSKKDNRLELAMEVDGHRLYKYRSLNHIPVMRETVVRIGYAKMELGVRPTDMQAFVSLQKTALNDGNITEAAQLLGFFETQIGNFASERIALEIGGYAALVDDEPHDEITEQHNALKKELLEKHPAVRLFFLSESSGVVAALNTSITASEMMAQLTDPTRRKREELFLRLIRMPLFAELWTVLTPPPSGWQKRLAQSLRSK